MAHHYQERKYLQRNTAEGRTGKVLRVGMDILKFPKSSSGKKYAVAMVFIDYSTR